MVIQVVEYFIPAAAALQLYRFLFTVRCKKEGEGILPTLRA